MHLLKQLWNDERGFVNSAELILIATLAVIGMIVGLATFRDAVVQELADTGAAIGQINQSYDIYIRQNGHDSYETGPVITLQGKTVTVQRRFTHGGAGAYVHTLSSFRNYQYLDAPDVGDGNDSAGLPPGIVSISGTSDEVGGPAP